MSTQDYATRKNKHLKTELKRRGIPLRGLTKKGHYVNALQVSDQKYLATYQAWLRRVEEAKEEQNLEEEDIISEEEDDMLEEEDQMLKKEEPVREGWERPIDHDSYETPANEAVYLGLLRTRQSRMFASKYKEDPTRKIFLDLPAETRNMIYELALIGDPKPDWKLTIVGPEGKVLPWHRQYYAKYGWYNRQETAIATLSMLSPINRQIRSEARSLFWARSDVRLSETMGPNMSQHKGLRCFLTAIGPEGRACLPDLRLYPFPVQAQGHWGTLPFKRFFSSASSHVVYLPQPSLSQSRRCSVQHLPRRC
jgi:hypothetical protein